MGRKLLYKVERLAYGAPEYAIRYSADRSEEYAKVKNKEEFRTDFMRNGTAYEVYISGKNISKKVYDAF